MLAGLVDGIIRARGTTLFLMLALSIAAGWSLPALKVDGAFAGWFRRPAPAPTAYAELIAVFGSDQRAIVAVLAEDVYTPAVLNGVHALSEALMDLPDVRRVRSLTHVRVFTRAEPDVVDIEPLVPRLPVRAEDLPHIRRRALADRMSTELRNEAGTATAIIVELAADATSAQRKAALARAIRGTAAAHPIDGAELRFAGEPFLAEATTRAAQRDFPRLAAFASGLVAAITWLMFGSLLLALLPLLVAGLSSLWVFGLMGAWGTSADILTQALLALIFAVAVAGALRLLAEYYRQLMKDASYRRGSAPRPIDAQNRWSETTPGAYRVDDRHAAAALRSALRELLVPHAVATVSAAAGTLALTTSTLGPLVRFGAFAAVGIGAAFLCNVTLLPALLYWLPTPTHSRVARTRTSIVDRLVDGLVDVGDRRRWTVMLGFSIAVALSLLAVPRLGATAHPLDALPDGGPVHHDLRAVEAELGGAATLEVLVSAPPAGFESPERVRHIQRLAARLAEQDHVTAVGSPADALLALNEALTGAPSIPWQPHIIAQAYALLEEETDLEARVSPARDRARLSALVPMSKARTLALAAGDIEADLRRAVASTDLDVRVTGFIALTGEIARALIDTQVRSVLIAVGLISLLVILVLASPRLGALAMIPSFGPALVGLGFMSATAIRIDPVTVTVASVAVGLTVDDTLRLLLRYRAREEEGMPRAEAILGAARQTGRSLMTTGLTLAAAFGVLGMARLTPNVHFAAVTSLVIGVGVLADLVVVPAALLTLRGRVR